MPYLEHPIWGVYILVLKSQDHHFACQELGWFVYFYEAQQLETIMIVLLYMQLRQFDATWLDIFTHQQ
jgi:hypothetical protein